MLEKKSKPPKYTTIRRSLLVNLLIMTIVLSAALILTSSYGTRRAVRALSAMVLQQTVEHTESELNLFFEPVVQNLALIRSWAREGVLKVSDREKLNRLFIPIVSNNPQMSSMILADERGHELLLLKTRDSWMNRETRRDEWGSRSRVWTWRQGESAIDPQWENLDYDPRRRPWFRGAMAKLKTAESGKDGTHAGYFYTRPYTFFTTKEPGVTASVAFESPDGRVLVAGIDVLLKDISRFTMDLKVSRNGKVVILSDQDDRVIGLPGYPRFKEKDQRRRALLKKIDKIDVPVVTEAIKIYRSHVSFGDRIFEFKNGGQNWWAIMRPYPVAVDRVLRITVVVPEIDLLGSLKLMWLWILLILLGILLLAVVRVVRLTGRYSRPIQSLVQESRRIAQGDLDSGPPIGSSVDEFRRLARAHDEMRRGLRILLKLERDVQLARRIQKDTLPRRLPELSGYQITGWSQPAEGAAGDTFDVIGLQGVSSENGYRISEEQADGAIFLLADATGHGIGPALSVTQVRAMLRMAVRSGEDLRGIIRHMNDQLMEDLKEGRFITAWLGQLDAATHRLTSFSLGQAPLLHYRAEQDAFRILTAQVPPFGTIDEIEVNLPDPIEMAAGDLFVALSDGLYEPTDPQGRMFGKQRVMDIIRSYHQAAPQDILKTIREEIERFTADAPADDDRTAVIIKRKE